MSESVVKSAARVLEVFEYFSNRRSSASVSDVCSALGYPQSSTSVLLKSLLSLGYLSYDVSTRRYLPTQRVALLGSWIHETTGGLPALMEELSNVVNETVVLAQQNGLYVQYIQVVEAHNGSRPHLPIGTRRPLTRTASGRVLLSLMSDAQILRILRRLNSQEERPENRVDERELLSAITQMRQTGFTTTENTMTRGVGSVATFAPQLPGQPPLALAVVVPVDRLRKSRETIMAAMKRMLPHNLAPRPPREISFGTTTLYTPATAVPIMPRRVTFGTEIS